MAFTFDKKTALLCFTMGVLLPSAAGLAFGGELPRVIHFDKKAYAAQNQNWMIAQSPGGFMYFANSAGLLEYDGTRWRLYALPERQIVRSVACDEQGRIFTGAYGEFGYWAPQDNGELRYISLSERLRSERVDKEEIWNIIILPGKVVFQSFAIIYEYDYEQVRPVTPPGNIMFIGSVDDRLIVPVLNGGLYEWHGGEAFTFIKGSEALARMRVKAVLSHPRGLLVGAEQNGFFLRVGERFLPWGEGAASHIGAYQINRAAWLSDGSLAVGTVLNGLFVLDANGAPRYHLHQEAGLQNNTVLALYEDRHGDLWAGLDKGIDLIALSDPLQYYFDQGGKTGATYTAALWRGRLYLGANRGLYSKPWPGPASFELIPNTQGQVWELRATTEQLLCGHNEGAFSVVNGRATPISPVTGGWSTALAPGRDDVLLQGAYTGLTRYHKDARGFWRFDRRLIGFLEPLKKILFDDERYLWGLHPYRGLYRFRLSPSLDSLLEIKAIGKAQGLPSDYRLSLAFVDGRVVVSCDTTLLAWSEREARFTPLDSLRGVPLRGNAGKYLPGQYREWFQVLPNQVRWFRDSTLLADLPVSLIPDHEHIVALNNELYLLCLDNGYALLDRWKGARPERPPSPQIRQVWVEKPKVFALSMRREEHALPARHNQLRFQFALPWYTQQPLFRCHLRHFDQDWSDWSTVAERTYTNLPPGRYVFEVQSNHSPQTAVFHFHIAPHWSRSPLAQIFYVLLALGLAWLLLRWHHYRLERQRRRLEVEKIRQLQQQRIRDRNEQLQRDIINKSKELANSTFNLVRKNEILQQLKGELSAVKGELGNWLPEAQHRRLSQIIDRHLTVKQDWQVFESNFNQVHEAFFRKIKSEYPALTPGELKLAACLKMNLASKEIAQLLNISVRGVENKRYRLRKKLGLGNEDNLTDFMLRYD